MHMQHTVLWHSYKVWRENLFNLILTAVLFLQKCPVTQFVLLLCLCLLFPPAADRQLCHVFYAPCHVPSLPKSCSQLRSKLRSAGIDGTSAQRACVHYFYFLTEAVNPVCSDVHALSLICPTRDQTKAGELRMHRKEKTKELLRAFFHCLV